MARLITVARFIKEYFEMSSRPKVESVKEWIDSGEIKGVKIRGNYYVDLSAFELFLDQPAIPDEPEQPLIRRNAQKKLPTWLQ